MRRRSSILLFSIIATSFYSFNAFADDTASSTFSIDVSNAALQVTAPATASIELNPTSSSAVFGSTNITVNVATNNTTGYTITMSVPTTDLIHSEITGNNAPVIPSLQSSAPQSTFPSNSWGYKVTGDNYNPVLLSNTNPSWATENPTNGTDHIISLAAKVDGTKHSGTYTNTLTFNVVANPVSAKDIITFDKNNENASGTMGTYTVQAEETKNLPANTFVAPAGYHFTGWSTTTNGQGSNVRFYGDTAPYTATDTGVNKQVTLYAQWSNLPACVDPNDCDVDPDHVPEGGTVGTTFQRAYEIAYTAMHKGMYEEQHEGQGDYALVNSWPPDNEPYRNYDVRFAMQDMTPEICASVTAMHDDYQALDIRDNKLYHITKMQDGHCWMTQNLDLDLSTEKPLRHSDTDLGWTNFDENATWTPKNSTVDFDINGDMSGVWPTGYNADRWNPHSANPGEIVLVPSSFVNNNTKLENDTHYSSLAACVAAGFAIELCSHYAVGNYYNWTAMIAENNTNTTFYKTSYNIAPNSICPAGWRMPYGPKKNTTQNYTAENTSEYNRVLVMENLAASYVGVWGGSNMTSEAVDLRSSPLYFTRAGKINNESSMDYYGEMSLYWTNTVTSGSGAFLLRYGMYGSIKGVQPQIDSGHGPGYPLRCLAR